MSIRNVYRDSYGCRTDNCTHWNDNQCQQNLPCLIGLTYNSDFLEPKIKTMSQIKINIPVKSKTKTIQLSEIPTYKPFLAAWDIDKEPTLMIKTSTILINLQKDSITTWNLSNYTDSFLKNYEPVSIEINVIRD